MANLSEDKVALTIGRLTLRLLAAEQALEELQGQYFRQGNTLDNLQAVVDHYEKEAMENGVSPEGSRHQGT